MAAGSRKQNTALMKRNGRWPAYRATGSRGEWRMENGEWRMENGVWSVECGVWSVEFEFEFRLN